MKKNTTLAAMDTKSRTRAYGLISANRLVLCSSELAAAILSKASPVQLNLSGESSGESLERMKKLSPRRKMMFKNNWKK